MKKKLVLILVAIFVGNVLALITTLPLPSRLSVLTANVEALSDDETSQRHGRYRTVGCGSVNVSDWRPYCCPHEYYDTCPDYIDPNECRLLLQYIVGCE